MLRFLRSVVLAAAAGAALTSALMSAAPAAAAETAQPAPGSPVVFPGMEIRQGSSLCTLGYVDTAARIAFSAGHCGGYGPVTDADGRFLGTVSSWRDNTPDGSVVRVDQVISDYQVIDLATDVVVNDMTPVGRQLVADAAAPLAVGQPVCHYGVITGESCGTIERINNGWFTMDNGVVSRKGDSGGPVYTLAADGTAILIGLFNSTWGHLPVAVSWQATSRDALRDGGSAVVTAVAARN